MQKPITEKIQKEGMKIWKKLLQRTSNSENEGKCVKNNRKALTESWKLKNENLRRENAACMKRSNTPGRLCFEESVSDLVQGKIVRVEENKNLQKKQN